MRAPGTAGRSLPLMWTCSVARGRTRNSDVTWFQPHCLLSAEQVSAEETISYLLFAQPGYELSVQLSALFTPTLRLSPLTRRTSTYSYTNNTRLDITNSREPQVAGSVQDGATVVSVCTVKPHKRFSVVKPVLPEPLCGRGTSLNVRSTVFLVFSCI